MVQLSPSPSLIVSSPPECSEEGERPGNPATYTTKMGSPGGLSAFQLHLDVSTAYQGYETYIEDGLICLKHKIRNMEKRKLKLEDYTTRVKHGDTLNKDQMEAVGKYQELLHNLSFAQELHNTLDGLTQNLLRAQKKAARKEQLVKVEAERRRLSTVLRIQHLLSSLQQEHIRTDLLAGHNLAPHVPAQQLENLMQLAALLGIQRDSMLSVGDQMEKSALVYFDLLEGKHKPVAGSTFKALKGHITRLLDFEYFNVLPPRPSPSPEALPILASYTSFTMTKTSEVSHKESFNRLRLTDKQTPPTQNWKAEFQALKEREPPDSWDMDFSDRHGAPQPAVQKPWRGAATVILKVPATKAETTTTKRKKRKKAKGDKNVKAATSKDTPVEVFNSPSALPRDPVLRKQQLEDLMTKIHGSFSFMQDSLLDCEGSSTNGHARRGRRSSGSPSLLAKQELPRSPVDVLPEMMHSTPLPARCSENETSLTNGEQSLKSCDLSLSAGDISNETLQFDDDQPLITPPLYRRESAISEDRSLPRTPLADSGKQSPCNGVAPCTPTTPLGRSFTTPPARRSLTSEQFQNIQSVFKVNGPFSENGEMNYKQDTRYTTASTQTPPEFALPEDDSQPLYQSEYAVDNVGQIFLSPGQTGRSAGRSGHPYYARGFLRGMTRGGKGPVHPFRSSGWQRGGAFIPGAHLRDTGPVLYSAREPGFQHGYRRGGAARHSSSGWSDSSQVSSPDREGTYPVVDSGHGDSLSVSTLEIPVTPHAHHQAPLLPVPLYPLSPPMRVAFTASRTANFAPGNLDQPIVFDQLHSNLGEMYDAHVGRFTSPANGTYVFLFHILKLAVNVPLYINLMCNEEVMVSAYANDGAPDHETASNHAILPLYQGDQVWLRLHRGAIYGSTWKYSTFSGFLLYHD